VSVSIKLAFTELLVVPNTIRGVWGVFFVSTFLTVSGKVNNMKILFIVLSIVFFAISANAKRGVWLDTDWSLTEVLNWGGGSKVLGVTQIEGNFVYHIQRTSEEMMIMCIVTTNSKGLKEPMYTTCYIEDSN